MTKIIDLPTTASTDANTFVPVYKNGKTQKVSATVFGGAECLRIDPTTGNVGIGTSAPANKFVVSDAGAQGLEILPNAAGTTWVYSFNRATDSSTPLILHSSALFFKTPSALFEGVFGYGPGAGGTVTQAKSKSAAVTLNKPSGYITLVAGSIAANSYAAFPVFNDTVNNGDTVTANLVGGVASGVLYMVDTQATVAGAFYIIVRNVTGAATPAGDAPTIQFNVHKGARS